METAAQNPPASSAAFLGTELLLLAATYYADSIPHDCRTTAIDIVFEFLEGARARAAADDAPAALLARASVRGLT
jgi:hypothetical protein